MEDTAIKVWSQPYTPEAAGAQLRQSHAFTLKEVERKETPPESKHLVNSSTSETLLVTPSLASIILHVLNVSNNVITLRILA